MKYVETVPPTTEPVTYAELKAHCRMDDDTEQVLITSYGLAARMYAEQYLNQSLVTRTIAATIYGKNDPAMPMPAYVALPRGPVQSISSITDTYSNTVASSNYQLRRIGNVDYVYFSNSPNYPIVVTYVAGYGGPSAVPQHIKTGIAMHAAHLWRSREAVTDISQIPVAHGLEAIYGLAGTGEAIG